MVSERRPIEEDDDQYEALEAEAVDNVEEASEEADELDGVSESPAENSSRSRDACLAIKVRRTNRCTRPE